MDKYFARWHKGYKNALITQRGGRSDNVDGDDDDGDGATVKLDSEKKSPKKSPKSPKSSKSPKSPKSPKGSKKPKEKEIVESDAAGDHSRLFFSANNLSVTNIDVQSVEPVDQRTLDSLQKSVQLAIEITTKSQEATARQEAERLEQEARGRLERQKITDEAEAERSRRRLIELQAQSSAVESTGQATAEAKARAEAAQIEGEAEVRQARLAAEAARIKHETDLEQLKLQQEAQLSYKQRLNELELTKASELADIEGQKFKDIVDAIGADTIKAIAQAGPEMQAKLLQGLGLQGFMITDGTSPINLFNTANGFVGGLPGAVAQANARASSRSSVTSDDF